MMRAKPVSVEALAKMIGKALARVGPARAGSMRLPAKGGERWVARERRESARKKTGRCDIP